MSRPRVAILDHPRSFFPLDLHEAIREEFEPVWVVSDPAMADNHRRLLQHLGTVIDIAGRDLDSAAEAIRLHGPQAIVTFVDDLLVVCAEIAARLGLRAHRPEVAAALIDKRRQRAAMQRAGVPGPRFWPVASHPSTEEIEIIAGAAHYPVVGKEAAGASSRNMRSVESADELRRLLADDAGIDRIVEELLPDLPGRDPRFGGYLSVESMVHEGQVRHLAAIGRTPLAEPFRESGSFVPALSGDISDAVHEAAAAAARALDVRTGMLHTEIKLTPDGPMVIEINGRLGGTTPYLIREATDGVNLFADACRIALGELPELPDPLTFQRVAYWLVVQPPVWAAHVSRLDGVHSLSQRDDVQSVVVNRLAGAAVDWREGTLGHVMVVRGQVADHRALTQTIDAIRDTIVVEYGTGTGTGVDADIAAAPARAGER